ncbi:MAG: hypothetical protein ACRC8Z_03625 [Empedobacter falsenii]
MVKIEHNTLINLKTNSEKECVKIGLIDEKGNLETINFNYKVSNGKVTAL